MDIKKAGGRRAVSPRDVARIEKAIHFLSDQYRRSGFNGKPVVLHSLEVAFILLAAGATADAVIIAVLHDILEDSEVSLKEIEKEFGPKIAKGVLALTENKDVRKYEERYRENIGRLLSHGGELVMIKAADLLNNSQYIDMAKDPAVRKKVVGKIGYFLKVCEGLGHEELHGKLKERHAEEKRKLAKYAPKKTAAKKR